MKRFVVVMLVIVLVLVALGTAAFFGLGFYLSPQTPLAKADVIVAISGGETAARTHEAATLYSDGYAPHIIFSGAAADPSGPSNAAAMAKIAEADGVPQSAISLDEAADNTHENATDVAAMVQKAGYHSIILVTSPYHQRRAAIAFHRAMGSGVSIINHSSYDQNWRRSHWWATSYSRSLTLSELQKVIYELTTGNDG